MNNNSENPNAYLQKWDKAPEHSIETFTGLFFDLANPTPEMVCIEDIAHALSYTYRFSGHLPRPGMTVAQHSIMVAELLPYQCRFEGLLHDAPEAYIGDMPSPFKSMMPDFKLHENRIMQVICEKFGFNPPCGAKKQIIKDADIYQLHREVRCFRGGLIRDFEILSPDEAEKAFLQMFHELNAKR